MDAEVDRLLIRHTPIVREIAARVRRLILEAMPGAVEQVDPPDGLIAYGTGPRLGEQVLAIAPHANHVNLQFADGVDLADPAGLLEGTGKRVRHVKSRTLEDAERPALGELIAQAVARRRTPGKGTAGNPSRRT
ncbi:MAG: DUF1801 domain-containing protein [Chloroflexi bacterium]|nr:MAG: DUF1801 domain-containing protein [Chloroflexota bacterium]